MSIHTLQTDNVKKILSSTFMNFMYNTGTSNQTSCPYTPQ